MTLRLLAILTFTALGASAAVAQRPASRELVVRVLDVGQGDAT